MTIPNNKIPRAFGGENRPIIKRASESTRFESISLRYPLPHFESTALFYKNDEEIPSIGKKRNHERNIEDHVNKGKSGTRSKKRRPLKDVSNHSIHSEKQYPPHSVKKTKVSPKRPNLQSKGLDITPRHGTIRESNHRMQSKLQSTHQENISTSITMTGKDTNTDKTPKVDNRLKNKLNHDNAPSISGSSDMDCSSEGAQHLRFSKGDPNGILKVQTQKNNDSKLLNDSQPKSMESIEQSAEVSKDPNEAAKLGKSAMKQTDGKESQAVLQLLLKSCNHGERNHRRLSASKKSLTKISTGEKESEAFQGMVGSDIITYPNSACCDDESDVTADTALQKQSHSMSKSDQVIQINQVKRDEESYFSMNTKYPELPPGWKRKHSRSKNRPYYFHPDHGATWYFPGSGWKQIYSKTKNQMYYSHPDYGKTWFRPQYFNDDKDNIDEGNQQCQTKQSSDPSHYTSRCRKADSSIGIVEFESDLSPVLEGRNVVKESNHIRKQNDTIMTHEEITGAPETTSENEYQRREELNLDEDAAHLEPVLQGGNDELGGEDFQVPALHKHSLQLNPKESKDQLNILGKSQIDSNQDHELNIVYQQKMVDSQLRPYTIDDTEEANVLDSNVGKQTAHTETQFSIHDNESVHETNVNEKQYEDDNVDSVDDEFHLNYPQVDDHNIGIQNEEIINDDNNESGHEVNGNEKQYYDGNIDSVDEEFHLSCPQEEDDDIEIPDKEVINNDVILSSPENDFNSFSSDSFVNVTVRLKRLSLRVLNPQNNICSLQRLDEIIENSKKEVMMRREKMKRKINRKRKRKTLSRKLFE